MFDKQRHALPTTTDQNHLQFSLKTLNATFPVLQLQIWTCNPTLAAYTNYRIVQTKNQCIIYEILSFHLTFHHQAQVGNYYFGYSQISYLGNISLKIKCSSIFQPFELYMFETKRSRLMFDALGEIKATAVENPDWIKMENHG